MSEKIVVVKLLNGEEIIGTVVESPASGDDLVLTDILMIGLREQPGGQFGFMFAPYSPLTTKVKPFNQDHITWVSEATEQLVTAYKRATSKVIQPDKSLVLPT